MTPGLTPALTLHRTLAAGDALRQGALAPYRRLVHGEGEPHIVREELLAGGAARWRDARPRPLVTLAHVTDLQLADVESPVRFEFFNREWADPRFALLVPVQRPQEALTAQAVDATVRTLNRVAGGPVAGAPIDLAVTTGDAIDNAQWNELRTFLALLDGGLVRARSGGRRYEGVQAIDWPDDVFWRPDGDGPDGPDLFRRGYAFPHLPGIIERALETFRSAGLAFPWLACFGNHEALVQGVGALTPGLHEALVGGRKPLGLKPDADKDDAYETFVRGCEVFMDAPSRAVTADPDRRPVTRREFVEAHFAAGTRPFGHGFSARNRGDGTAYYSYDAGPVRYLALDTTCVVGGADGALDLDQLRWLEDRLIEVHSRFLAPDGSAVGTEHDDRLVVLFSHHGLDTLTNRRAPLGALSGVDGSIVVGAVEVEALLHRFPNVVLWLNGHTHTNGVRPRPAPHRYGGGFWEVTTCAVVDWPCQTRIVELVDDGTGGLAIACTMVDHDSPLSPGRLITRPQLASLHRELAANVPWAGAGSALAGTATDRNVILPLAAPFPLDRLPS